MIDLSTDGPIARLTLSRPGARNAVPIGGWSSIAAAATQAEQSGASLLIVSGERDGAFCAGADLSDFQTFRDDEAAPAEFRKAIREALDTLRILSIPVLALIEGACYGAGVALAMACDVRFAGPGARFAITPAKLGIAYPQEDIHRLVALVGPGHAARLLFSAATIDGQEAQRIGLVEGYFGEGLDEAVAAFAAAIADNDPDSLRVLKRGVSLAVGGVARNDDQDRLFDALLGSDALAQRLAVHRTRRRRD